MQKQIIAVQPAQLSEIWPQIREEVAAIECPDDFIPEDVFFHCKSNQATLFLLIVDGKRIGWMVLRQMGTCLHIWQLHAENGYDVMSQFRDELMEVARRAGCVKLTYGSSRKAWQKVAPSHGFKMQIVVWECPVDAPKAANDAHPGDSHPT